VSRKHTKKQLTIIGRDGVIGQMKLLVQTFRKLLDSVIQRSLRLAPSRALNNNVNLILTHAPFRQRRIEPQPLHEVQHRVAGLGGVCDVIARPRLADKGQNARNLRRVVSTQLGFHLHDVAERQAAGDAVRDAVGGAEGVAHCVAEAEAALHVLAKKTEGGKGGEVELRDGFGVVRVGGLGLGKEGEEARNGLQRELFARHFGRSRVVEELDSMVKSTDRRREPQVLGRVGAEGSVVQDGRRIYVRVADASFNAVGFGVAGERSALSSREGSRDRNMVQECAGLFVLAEGDCFGTVDGRPAADGDEGVDGRVLGDEIGGFVKLGNRRVLFYIGEGAGMVFGAEKRFDLLD
jgi:hypothetical protein